MLRPDAVKLVKKGNQDKVIPHITGNFTNFLMIRSTQ